MLVSKEDSRVPRTLWRVFTSPLRPVERLFGEDCPSLVPMRSEAMTGADPLSSDEPIPCE